MELWSDIENVELDTTELPDGYWKIEAHILGQRIYLAKVTPTALTTENYRILLRKAREVRQQMLVGEESQVHTRGPLLTFPLPAPWDEEPHENSRYAHA